MKTAIVNCADTGPLESLAVMLRTAGYDVYLPGPALHEELRKLGGLVLTNEQLVRDMGYERPDPTLLSGEATPRTMERADLYVDVKAHQTYHRLVERWPNLRGKVLWYRINGGKPEHVVRKPQHCGKCPKPDSCDWWSLGGGTFKCRNSGEMGHGEDCGDEVNPPCPVLTPNQWYRNFGEAKTVQDELGTIVINLPHPVRELFREGRSYSMWPPFHRFGEYDGTGGLARTTAYNNPVCLIHNAEGWGYQRLILEVRKLGVKVFGRGSPDGLVDHAMTPVLLSNTLCMVHLKSSDAPGYALYEALASGCPVVCTRRLIWRCRMQELLVPGETCLVFDRETHDGLTDEDVRVCTAEIKHHLTDLVRPERNRTIGEAGRERLKQVMWSKDKSDDVTSLQEFVRRNFP